MKKVLFWWLLMVCVVTFVCLTCYGTMQQVIRQDANEPQVQLAEDTAAALAGGASVDSLVQGDTVDISKSLAPFLIIYDRDQKVIASSGTLDGAMPSVPAGYLATMPQIGDKRMSWQPRPSLRFATVAVHVGGPNGGYVVAGRSLREAESITSRIGLLIFLAWVTGVVGFFVILVILRAIFGFWKKEKPAVR